MTILTTIPNGASYKDIRDTLNSVLARILALESGVTPAPSPTLSLSSAVSQAEGNSGTATVTTTATVNRNGVSGALVVNLAYAGTATSGTDYQAGPASITIASGQSTATFDLAIIGDATVESDETIIITATLAAYPSSSASRTITITNDDVAVVPAPSLSLSSAVTQVEGNSGTSTFTWTLTLVRDGSTAAFPYSYAVTGHGANPADAADFGGTFPSGSGTFAPGETSKTITVLVAGDTAVEPNETFLLTVSAAGLNTVTSTGTISNDDGAATLPNYRVALAAAQAGTAGPLIINSVFDSTGIGTGAGSGDATTDARKNAYPQKVAEQFAAVGLSKNGADIFGANLPLGTATAASYMAYNPSVTMGGWTVSTVSVLSSMGGNSFTTNTAGADFTWTAENRPFTNLVLYGVQSSSQGVFKVLVDNVDRGNVVCTNATEGVVRLEITGLSATTHTVALRWVSGSVCLIGMETIDTTNKQSVRIRNLGQGSITSTGWVSNTKGWDRIGGLTKLDPAHLHIVEAGQINDWLNAVPATTTASNVTTIMTTLQAKGGDVLLLGATRSQDTGGNRADANQQATVNAIAALANGSTKTFYDMAIGTGGVGKYPTMLAAGRMFDTVHPNEAGYTAQAAATYNGALAA